MVDNEITGLEIESFENEMASAINVEEVESAYAAIVTCDKGICPF